MQVELKEMHLPESGNWPNISENNPSKNAIPESSPITEQHKTIKLLNDEFWMLQQKLT